MLKFINSTFFRLQAFLIMYRFALLLSFAYNATLSCTPVFKEVGFRNEENEFKEIKRYRQKQSS